jgi:hypothetical protein
MTDAKSLLTWAVEFVERQTQLPMTGAYAPSATCRHGIHPYDCEICQPPGVSSAARRWLAEAREYLEKSGTTQG